MTRTRTLTLAAVLALGAAGVVLAMSTAGDQAAEPRTLTGCLRTGSAPAVFLLRGAALPAAIAPAPDGSRLLPEDFVLVAVPAGTDLNTLVNHRIAVTGVVIEAKDPPAAPGEANAAERALKKIRVQSVKDVAGNCS
ncbi:MAG TPA: hypothetical protein VFV98_07090 [Vicinamibacterales bacterium]|nr:hypothetical protein [Vicinamibacterales bacterium]